MPKVVDHDQRRVEIIEAAWRTIARTGWDSATMAAIAAEAGFANGALKPYFATKDDLLAAAFDHIYVQTGRRMVAATAGKHGLAALRAYCREILPLDETTRDEARVVLPFWHKALTTAHLAARHERAMREWRTQLQRHLSEARDAGEVRTPIPDEDIVGHLLTALLGAQITATLMPDLETAQTLTTQLDAFLELLRGPAGTSCG
ncbi:TetR/AcrR family transcriptional regulator [Micromonospora deserti]|uniref:TetR family transcriptional regulator n=1 Tax=Micromonospora deserti TaxID=2070366 RepID=A0A2W2D043_9ACTN|nr:TetR family transcriptional regulator C-terminal domain-containing protein [Micromonospora deserti]PZF90646.1 TetR family transcriptional regulator [Micromonospora deserti]